MPLDVRVGQELADLAWDSFVEATRGGTYQQTSMWAEVKSPAGWRPIRIVLSRDGAVMAGCQILVRRAARLGAVAYVPYGPLVSNGDTAALPAMLDVLQRLVRQERFLYLKLQPPPGGDGMSDALTERRFVPSGLDTAPRFTVRVDLRRSPDAILGAMRARTRTYIRQAERRGVVVRDGTYDELPVFYELVEATSRRQGFAPYPRSYYEQIWRSFQGHAHLLFADYQGDVLSSALLLGFGDSVNFKMGGWLGCHRDVRPNELLHWVGMQWARDRGYRYYDLEGIDRTVAEAIVSGRDSKDLPVSGLTHFKLGLGGEVVEFPGSYDYVRQRVLQMGLRWVAPRLDRLTPVAHRIAGRRKPGSGMRYPDGRASSAGKRYAPSARA
jgi:lipid II:glycine glycyltransferase (peptidoglycan interpeptide bridge formation enzyme)